MEGGIVIPFSIHSLQCAATLSRVFCITVFRIPSLKFILVNNSEGSLVICTYSTSI